MMRAQLRKPLTLLGSALAAGVVAASFGATAADAAVTKAAPAPHCAVLVGKSINGAASPVLARACDATVAGARAKMVQEASKSRPKSTVRPLADDLLMTWYSDANYKGASTGIYGDYGPCDSGGYRLDTRNSALGVWSLILSSAKGTSQCNNARFANRAGTYSQAFRLPVPYLGSLLNDNVGTIWVYNR